MNSNNFIQQLDQNFSNIVEAGFIHDQEYKSVIHKSNHDPDEFESLVMRIFFITMDPEKKIKYFINQYAGGQFLYLVELYEGTWLYVLSSNEAFAKMHFFVKYVTSDEPLDMSDIPEVVPSTTNEGEEAAKRIQKLLFADPIPMMKGFSKAELWYKPKMTIGGDFYWGKKTKNNLWIVVGDCTGHSVEGALATVSVLSILDQVFDDEAQPHILIKRIHQSLENIQKQKLEDGYGIGNEMMVIKYETNSGELAYSATGISLYHKRTKVVRYKTKKAVYEPDRVIKYLRSRKLKIEEGDEVLVHSDGVTDQMNDKFKRLKPSVLLDSLKSENGMYIDSLKQLVNDWSNGEEQTDDIVALHFRR